MWRESAGWLASRDASLDPSIGRQRPTQDQRAADLRHTYRLLLTRGMRGTAVHSTDAETQVKLRQLTRVEPLGINVDVSVICRRTPLGKRRRPPSVHALRSSRSSSGSAVIHLPVAGSSS